MKLYAVPALVMVRVREAEKRRRPRGRLRDDRDGERSVVKIECIAGSNWCQLNFETSAVSFTKNAKITEAQYLRLSRSTIEGCGYRRGGQDRTKRHGQFPV
jgi:hypothetical protein